MFYASLSLSPPGRRRWKQINDGPGVECAVQAEALAVYHLLSEGNGENNFRESVNTGDLDLYDPAAIVHK